MKTRLIYSLLATIILLPLTVSAGPTTETPITTFPTFRPAAWPPWPTLLPGTDLPPMGPYKLFDNLYYVGTNNVGAYIVDTGAGLIIIDAG